MASQGPPNFFVLSFFVGGVFNECLFKRYHSIKQPQKCRSKTKAHLTFFISSLRNVVWFNSQYATVVVKQLLSFGSLPFVAVKREKFYFSNFTLDKNLALLLSENFAAIRSKQTGTKMKPVLKLFKYLLIFIFRWRPKVFSVMRNPVPSG